MLTLSSTFVQNDIGRYIKAGASIQPDRSRTTYIVVHHAAAMYSPGKACASIFTAHCNRPDFGTYNRIGYHEVIQVELGDQLRTHLVNPPNMQGAGVFGRNDVCYHICAASNFTAIPDEGFIEALAQRVAAAKRVYNGAVVVGHKEIAQPGHGTTCPGPLWDVWKPRIYARVDALLKPPTAGPRTYRVRSAPVYQQQSLSGPIAAELPSGTTVEIGKTYDNGAGWLTSGLGFVRLSDLEDPV